MPVTVNSQRRMWQIALQSLFIASVVVAVLGVCFALEDLRIAIVFLGCGGFGLILADVMRAAWSVVVVWVGLLLYIASNYLMVCYSGHPIDWLFFFAIVGPISFVIIAVAVHISNTIKFRRFTWFGIVMLMALSFAVNSVLLGEFTAAV